MSMRDKTDLPHSEKLWEILPLINLESLVVGLVLAGLGSVAFHDNKKIAGGQFAPIKPFNRGALQESTQEGGQHD